MVPQALTQPAQPYWDFRSLPSSTNHIPHHLTHKQQILRNMLVSSPLIHCIYKCSTLLFYPLLPSSVPAFLRPHYVDLAYLEILAGWYSYSYTLHQNRRLVLYLGKVILFDQICSFRRDVHGVRRGKETPT